MIENPRTLEEASLNFREARLKLEESFKKLDETIDDACFEIGVYSLLFGLIPFSMLALACLFLDIPTWWLGLYIGLGGLAILIDFKYDRGWFGRHYILYTLNSLVLGPIFFTLACTHLPIFKKKKGW